ncbi:MAG: peptidoglycan-binding protein [Myxococcales bacterium]|nr:peptidoglycan-binding protein [Myxococcales bacterium]
MVPLDAVVPRHAPVAPVAPSGSVASLSRADVQHAQAILAWLGYLPRTPESLDGMLSPALAGAVRTFQASYNEAQAQSGYPNTPAVLAITGMLDADTIGALSIFDAAARAENYGFVRPSGEASAPTTAPSDASGTAASTSTAASSVPSQVPSAPAPSADVVVAGEVMPLVAPPKQGITMEFRTPPMTPFWWLVSTASGAASAFHGYRRNNGSIPWAVTWGFLGGLFPVITPAIAVAQGFGEPVVMKPAYP